MMQRTCTPRGAASLGELLAVMTGLGVAMAVATGLVHTGMRQQSASRLEFERDRTAMRLARDVRDDVRAAVAVTIGEADANVEPGQQLLQLTLTDGDLVRYLVTEQGLTRNLVVPGRRVHEDYVFSVPMQWSASFENGCVRIHGVTPPPSVQGDVKPTAAPLEIHLEAASTADAALSDASGEDDPRKESAP